MKENLANNTQDLKNIFDLFALEDSNLVQAKDLQRCLLSFENDTSTSTSAIVYTLLSKLESKALANESLTFEEFLTLFESACPGYCGASEMKKIFALFDPSMTGCITATTLEQVMTEIGEPYSKQQIQQMIKFADIDGDGVVSLDEFETLMNTLNTEKINQRKD